MENNYLTHYGIKGQRWGVRRFQNKDGSLTPRGRKQVKTSTSTKKEVSPEQRSINRAKLKRGISVGGKILGVVGTILVADYIQAKATGDMSIVESGRAIASLYFNKLPAVNLG